MATGARLDVNDEGGQAEGFSWENKYAQSWEILREDDSGTLQTTYSYMLVRDSDYLRRRKATADAALQRSIMRHLVILIDWSIASASTEVSPNRGVWIINTCVKPFITDFFEQNPLSQVCIIALCDGVAEKISELSSNIADHDEALDKLVQMDPKGAISLQNGLEVANSVLTHIPDHGSREALLLQIGLASIDPGNIFEIIAQLTKNKVRVSIVSFSSEVAIGRRIAKETSGSYGVALDDTHFMEIIREQLTPPLALIVHKNASTSYLINMGFPSKVNFSQPILCTCHGMLKYKGFRCPRCHTIVCQVPVDCTICGLTLISAPHLARSYHHLFPVPVYDDLDVSGERCSGCDMTIDDAIKTSLYSRAGKCRRCHHAYCSLCTKFIHEELYNCPGCN